VRILWHSVAPWLKTGYGVQTDLFTRRIRDLLGHDVAISSWTWRGGMGEFRGMPVYPHGAGVIGPQNDNVGNEILAYHARHWRADLVITLTDSWVFEPRAMKRIPWVAWTPIDHDPVPPKVLDTLERGYAVPVAYSRFGEGKLREAGLSPLYVPHGCHEIYFQKTSKRAARKTLGFPENAFIVGMVGVNQGAPNRKSYPQCLEAFQRFHRRHRDTFLYMHTLSNAPQGLDLDRLIQHLKIDSASYRFPDPYQHVLGYSEKYLRDVYSAMDVLLTPNMGEGFGVPIIEAQACGTPIIGTDFSTMPELCFFGELIVGEPYYTTQGAYQRLPSSKSIYCALKKVYGYSAEDYRKGASRARRAMRRYYHPDVVTRHYWQNVLTTAKTRIGAWEYAP
jgi:glycosyltransferase involved in cell wall biosynthesis